MELAFLSNSQDVHRLLTKKINLNKSVIYASAVEAPSVLKKLKIPFRLLNPYIPFSITKKNYAAAHKTALLFNPTIFATVRLFLLEVGRSQYMAKKILDRHRPSTVYICDRLSQSLYQKYYRETFDLLPQAIIALCQAKQIKVSFLGKLRGGESLLKSLINLHLNNFLSFITAGPPPKLPPKKTILFSASGYHLTQLKAVITALSSSYQIISLGKSTEGKRTVNPYSYLTFTDIVKYWIKLITNFAGVIARNPVAGGTTWQSQRLVNSWPIIKSVLRFWRFGLIPQGHLLEIGFTRMIEKLKPVLLVTSNSIDNYNRTLHSVVQRHHIPNAVVLHYPMTDDIDAIEEQSGIEKNLLVSSHKSAEIISRHHGNYRVFVTGSPEFDQYRFSPTPLPEKIDPPVRIIFLLTQEFLYFQDENTLIVTEALQELDKLPFPIQVTLRQHPHELPLSIVQFNFQIEIRNDIPLIDELNNHHIVIAQATSAAVDAIILKKPLIYLNTHGLKDFRPFAKESAALGVYKKDQLNPAIKSLISNPSQLVRSQKKFVDKYCFIGSKPASVRIASCLKSLVHNHAQ